MVALAGVDLANFWLALILLGVGWNFGFIGATAMLTETYRPEEKNTVQGLNDFLVFGSVALASLSSGKLYAIGRLGTAESLRFSGHRRVPGGARRGLGAAPAAGRLTARSGRL